MGSHYDDIKHVFSIWICMNMDENSINHVHLTNDALLGSKQWGGKLDLLNIVLIGISDVLSEHEEEYALHRLLGTLLSDVLSTEEKLDIIETEYDISVEDGMRKDVDIMCNLSQGILERGMAQGIEVGKADGIEIGKEGVIVNMYKKGYPSEHIAEIVEKDIREVETIIRRNGLATS